MLTIAKCRDLDYYEELQQSVASVGNDEQRGHLDEVVGQRRLFDLGDLAAHLTA